MKLVHVHHFRLPRERVFAGLTDPAVLASCIDGCERLDEVAPGVYETSLKVGPGLLPGSYRARLELSQQRPPESLRMRVEGQGPPGFARADALIRLAESGGGTDLTGEGELTAGGLLAAMGPKLIESTAQKALADFFRRLAAKLA